MHSHFTFKDPSNINMGSKPIQYLPPNPGPLSLSVSHTLGISRHKFPPIHWLAKLDVQLVQPAKHTHASGAPPKHPITSFLHPHNKFYIISQVTSDIPQQGLLSQEAQDNLVLTAAKFRMSVSDCASDRVLQRPISP